MKFTIIFLISFFTATTACGQPMPDSVLVKYNSTTTGPEKGQLLTSYFGPAARADSAKTAHAFELYSWFKKNKDEVGADYSQLFIAGVLNFKSEYAASLKLNLKILSNFERRNDRYGLIHVNNAIGLTYVLTNNYDQSFDYLKKAIPLAQELQEKESLSRTYNVLGIAYASAAMPDSGIVYAQRSVSMDKEMKNDRHLAVSLGTLAMNYMASKEYKIAIPFQRRSMGYYLSQKIDQDKYGVIAANNNFAQAYLALEHYDSTNHYAREAIALSIPLGYKEQTLRSYEYLYKSFEETQRIDSVYKYFRLAMTMKDSLFSSENTKNLEAMGFREQIRQHENEAEKVEAQQLRSQNIQLALIGIVIISFVMLFLLISHSFIANARIIEFMGSVALLLIFEFIYLVLHPFLQIITDHSAVWMLVALVSIAALLVPLHHKVEKWAVTRLVAKNNAIRLAAARKTIEKLDDTSSNSTDPDK